jgi:hypothetical protein
MFDVHPLPAYGRFSYNNRQYKVSSVQKISEESTLTNARTKLADEQL